MSAPNSQKGEIDRSNATYDDATARYQELAEHALRHQADINDEIGTALMLIDVRNAIAQAVAESASDRAAALEAWTFIDAVSAMGFPKEWEYVAEEANRLRALKSMAAPQAINVQPMLAGEAEKSESAASKMVGEPAGVAPFDRYAALEEAALLAEDRDLDRWELAQAIRALKGKAAPQVDGKPGSDAMERYGSPVPTPAGAAPINVVKVDDVGLYSSAKDAAEIADSGGRKVDAMVFRACALRLKHLHEERDAVAAPECVVQAIYPTQCKCGHIFLEKYQFQEPTPEGVIGFCWCGFCRTRVNVLAAAPSAVPAQNAELVGHLRELFEKHGNTLRNPFIWAAIEALSRQAQDTRFQSTGANTDAPSTFPSRRTNEAP